ncbi:MAG TPA: DUF5318 family protein [Microthrixaceae bacterium]|nr:DUF5318 family protein [Microthrixaceae bacterium]
MEFLQPRAKGRPGQTPGSVDYRLARQRALRGLRKGDADRADFCDAQAELVRVAVSCSERAGEPCPVCDGEELRVVRFVFGPRLPKGGRCVSSELELRRLAHRAGEHRCYVVEVCPQCRWNHLLSTHLLGAERSA